MKEDTSQADLTQRLSRRDLLKVGALSTVGLATAGGHSAFRTVPRQEEVGIQAAPPTSRATTTWELSASCVPAASTLPSS